MSRRAGNPTAKQTTLAPAAPISQAKKGLMAGILAARWRRHRAADGLARTGRHLRSRPADSPADQILAAVPAMPRTRRKIGMPRTKPRAISLTGAPSGEPVCAMTGPVSSAFHHDGDYPIDCDSDQGSDYGQHRSLSASLRSRNGTEGGSDPHFYLHKVGAT